MLTQRQREILEFIRDYQLRNGVAPTLREIQQAFGMRSIASVHKHLVALERRKAIRRARGARALQVLEPAPPPAGVLEVPLLGTVAAGQPIEAIPIPETVTIPAELAAGPETYVLRVRGDSMIDEQIRSGDLIVVRRAETARDGELVIALIDHEDVTLKRLYHEPDGRIRLQPANPAHEPIVVAAERVTIQGVVVGLIRSYR